MRERQEPRELARGALGRQEVIHVLRPWLGGGLAIKPRADKKDAGAVQRAGDLFRQKRGVVVVVIPAQSARVEALGPQTSGELDGIDGFVGVDRDGLAIRLELLATEGPQQRIEER